MNSVSSKMPIALEVPNAEIRVTNQARSTNDEDSTVPSNQPSNAAGLGSAECRNQNDQSSPKHE
jgi:hypothetical protein